jgi:sugar lactone lactonase YvrE
VTDVNRVWKIDVKGAATVLADDAAFSEPVVYLNDAACQPGGKVVYVTDMGANTRMRDPQGNLWPLDSPGAEALPAIGRVYRIGLDGKVQIAVDKSIDMPCPNGVSVAGPGRLLIGEFFKGTLLEARGKKLHPIASGMRGADAIEPDGHGNVYVSSWTQGKVFKVGKGQKEPEVVAEGFQAAADFFLDKKGHQILVPDMKAGTLVFLPLPK